MGCGASGKYAASENKAQSQSDDQRFSEDDAPVKSQSVATICSRKSLEPWADSGFTKQWSRAPSMSIEKELNNPGKVTDDYDVQKWSASARIGKGASGSVYRAVHRETGYNRAVKKCYKVNADDIFAFKREAVLISNVDHPNIIKIIEVFEDRRCCYFVFELCEGGELLKQITESDSFTERKCIHVMAQILQSVSYLHGKQICHRDLKPDNFLVEDLKPLEEATLKLIDFGSATFVEAGEFLETPLGTPAYMAPECFSGRYHLMCDIWSCGVIAYLLLSGDLPFDGDAIAELQEKVKCGKYSLEGPEWLHVSNEAKDFVTRCMRFEPEERCQSNSALGHVWLKQDCSDTVQMPVLTNLAKYFHVSKRRSMAAEEISSFLSVEICQRLRDCFEKKDTDALGALPVDDVATILQQSGLSLPYQHIRQLVSSWDRDSSGTIEYGELNSGLQQSFAQVEEEVIMAAFAQIDKDGNGVLSEEELAASGMTLKEILADESVVKVLGPSVAEDVMRKGDIDGDGLISFDEFMLLATGGRRASTYAKWSMDQVQSVRLSQKE